MPTLLTSDEVSDRAGRFAAKYQERIKACNEAAKERDECTIILNEDAGLVVLKDWEMLGGSACLELGIRNACAGFRSGGIRYLYNDGVWKAQDAKSE